ncbi:hypothetical protein PL9214650290 [Planktothrix tepida PCC 9214]|uniref:Uncharacterized protein n=1 Tax=Planktothrix tepida PCC 9214 TaxID=671072 RepID=A0A1J1LQP2_9CYAN|nr:hypothetical protein PL9214650290 [Planktothrix tepida PCC 9214]
MSEFRPVVSVATVIILARVRSPHRLADETQGTILVQLGVQFASSIQTQTHKVNLF